MIERRHRIVAPSIVQETVYYLGAPVECHWYDIRTRALIDSRRPEEAR